jgi:serine/threonine protein kinase
MSPEQTYGAEIDQRSDILSLGVVIYEVVTAQQPVKGHCDTTRSCGEGLCGRRCSGVR